MRRRLVLVLRRDDHKQDFLGTVFLGVVENPDDVREAVQRYLGSTVTVREVEVGERVLRVSAETSAFESESQNLARLGRSLLEKGRQRAAGDMFEEALRLDPFNTEALKTDAAMRLAAGDRSGARGRWVLAGEISGFDGEILRGLATIALEEDRRPSAMRYLEEALVVNPDDVESRDFLDDLRRQTELAFEGRDPARGPRK